MTEKDTTTRLNIRETVDGVATADAAVMGTSTGKTDVKEAPLRRYDPHIWGIYILLLIISIVELFSASSSEVTGSNVYGPLIRHGVFLGLGLLIVLLLQRTHYKWFKKYAAPIAVISLILLALVSFTSMGANINGAQRSMKVAGMTIQPPEIVKLTIMVWLASVLAKNQMSGGVTNKGIVYTAVIVLVFSGCVWRNGLTNMVIIMGVSICMMLIGNIQFRKFLIVMLVYGMCGGMLYMMKDQRGNESSFDQEAATTAMVTEPARKEVDRSGVRQGRLSMFLKGTHPDDEINDNNRQAMLAKFAQANGGLWGQGPGNSRESARLPLAFSDYIYSIVVEDTGLIGGIGLLLLYLWLLGRAGQIARKCTRVFPALLVMGCAVLIVLQALIHMSIVVGIVPVSGQPLPFISKGGTSILVMSAAIGMMLSVSRYGVTSGNKKAQKNELRELPTDLQAPNPMMNP